MPLVWSARADGRFSLRWACETRMVRLPARQRRRPRAFGFGVESSTVTFEASETCAGGPCHTRTMKRSGKSKAAQRQFARKVAKRGERDVVFSKRAARRTGMSSKAAEQIQRDRRG